MHGDHDIAKLLHDSLSEANDLYQALKIQNRNGKKDHLMLHLHDDGVLVRYLGGTFGVCLAWAYTVIFGRMALCLCTPAEGCESLIRVLDAVDHIPTTPSSDQLL